MFKYALKRILTAIPLLLIVTLFTFSMVRLAPGGPFDQEKAIPPEVKAAIEARYGMDRPWYEQYWTWLSGIPSFDLGPSSRYAGRSVDEVILGGLPITFELGFYAILFALFLGLVSGVSASLRPNSMQDYVPMSIAMLGICIPSFLLGPLLILVFVFWLDIFPVGGWDEPIQKVLPTIALGSAYAAYIARLSRGSMLEIMNQDYIRTARAKGVPEKWVVIRHGMKGGLLPVVSFLGPSIAGLLAGSFVTETIFNIPGMGRLYVQAAFNRDHFMVLGTTVVLAALVVAFNLASDIIAVRLNPRLSFDTGGEEA